MPAPHLIGCLLNSLPNFWVESVLHVDLSSGLLEHSESLDERLRHALAFSSDIKVLEGSEHSILRSEWHMIECCYFCMQRIYLCV